MMCDEHEDRPAVETRTMMGTDFHWCQECSAHMQAAQRRNRRDDRRQAVQSGNAYARSIEGWRRG
jgi:hypothetical protein